jgi:ribosomal protein S18 acetylase RimI-like enzyme
LEPINTFCAGPHRGIAEGLVVVETERMAPSLEPFRPSDAAEIARWASSAEEARRWGGHDLLWPLDPRVLKAWHADSDVRPFVLREQEALLAYGELWIDDDEREVELARIIVPPERRGSGVGRLLVSRLLEQAARTGHPAAFVRVVPENAAALVCYRAAGFMPVSAHERQRFNQGQPVGYVWLRRHLRSGPPAERRRTEAER